MATIFNRVNERCLEWSIWAAKCVRESISKTQEVASKVFSLDFLNPQNWSLESKLRLFKIGAVFYLALSITQVAGERLAEAEVIDPPQQQPFSLLPPWKNTDRFRKLEHPAVKVLHSFCGLLNKESPLTSGKRDLHITQFPGDTLDGRVLGECGKCLIEVIFKVISFFPYKVEFLDASRHGECGSIPGDVRIEVPK